MPFVKVTVSDRIAEITNLRWESQYTAALPDDQHDAAADADYLHRVRVRAGTPEYERDAGSGWSGLNAQTDSDVIAIAAVNDERVFVLYNRGAALYYRESTDQGDNFGSETLILATTATPNAVAAAYDNDGGDLVVLWEDGGAVKRIRRTSGSWGSAATWPHTITSVSGLSVAHVGDFHIALTGVDSDGRPTVWTLILGNDFSQPLDTWSALFELTHAEGGSGVAFQAPSLAVLDTHRLLFVEKYTGDIAYARPQWTWFPPAQSFAANAWREPVPFDFEKEFGVAITGAVGYAWISNPGAVWRAYLDSPELELSDDLLELTIETRRSSGRARVVLRNDDGRYNDLPSGDYAVIRPGAQLAISPGYVTSAGQEVSTGLRYRVEGWEYTSAGGEATFVLYANDAWSLVEGWRARRQHTWSAGSSSVSEILRFVFGRAGIELLNVGSSTTAYSHRPAFTIHPGEDGVRVVQRLLAMTPDVIFISGEFAFLFEPLASDSAVYAYGADHLILRGRYASAGLAANRAQVFGDDLVAEQFAWDDIGDQLDRLRQVHDLNITTVGLAEDRADATVRQEELSAAQGELVAPVNCGQEPYDVVEVSDPNAGLSAVKYRVSEIALKYSRRGRPTYEQRLLLGRV